MPEVRLRGRDRLVVVVADRVVIPAVTEVHRHVLVPEDRVRDLTRLAFELRDRVGPHQLVLHREERDRHAGHRGDGRTPDPRAHQHALALHIAPVGLHSVHATVPDIETRDGHAAFERDALGLRVPRQRRRQSDAVRDPVARHVVRPQDRRGVKERDLLHRLGRREELGAVEPVRAREALPALELVHALGSRRHLDAADAVPPRLAALLEPRVERDRVLRDPAHRSRAVRLEHEARGVRGGPAGLEQRSLVDHQDVGDPELGEVIRRARSDDPGADDDGLGPVPHHVRRMFRQPVLRRQPGDGERRNITRAGPRPIAEAGP